MTYWVSTGILAAFLSLSAASYLWHQPTIDGVRELGFPDFFRIQLAVLKFLAIPALLLPGMPLPLKEMAYAGVGLFLLTAIVAHAVHRDPIYFNVINVLLLGVLFASYLQNS